MSTEAGLVRKYKKHKYEYGVIAQKANLLALHRIHYCLDVE